MNRYGQQRPRRSRRFVAVFATLAVFGALIAVTQVSLANSRRGGDQALCPRPGATSPGTGGQSTGSASPGAAHQHDHGDATAAPAQPTNGAQAGTATQSQEPASSDARRGCSPTTAPTSAGGSPTSGTGAPPAPLQILGTSCADSQLQPHDGFQLGSRCVSTAFGEVGEAAANPTLLISASPLRVRINRPFTIQVSTRNLVRDRFLPAKDGGYYRESAYLNEDGLVRGHFHTACRMLTGRSAPDPAPVPVFFAATEDGKGGTAPDVVTVQVPGLPSAGIAQCAAWAGDGSHRIPMMQRANQIPAFDSVRILVTR
jgi:hypothetical protein